MPIKWITIIFCATEIVSKPTKLLFHCVFTTSAGHQSIHITLYVGRLHRYTNILSIIMHIRGGSPLGHSLTLKHCLEEHSFILINKKALSTCNYISSSSFLVAGYSVRVTRNIQTTPILRHQIEGVTNWRGTFCANFCHP